jgi:crotonobetainyl-CoA:carnitine CoA-transferase CaiB-like acyl-CoA transferase
VAVLPPSDLYRCAGDGPNDYAYLVVTTHAMWEGVLATIGRTDLLDDRDWSSRTWRGQNHDTVHEAIEGWTHQHGKFEVMEAMESNGVPCSAVFDANDVLTHHHMQGRGMIAGIEHPQRGSMEVPGNPVRLEDSPTEVCRAPLLGEHNEEVFGELLGLSAADLERLSEAGVV